MIYLMAEEGIILRAVLKIQSNCHSEERSDEKSRFFSQNEEQDSSLPACRQAWRSE